MKIGDKYYTISSKYGIQEHICNNTEFDKICNMSGNYYTCYEEAKVNLKYNTVKNELYSIARELGIPRQEDFIIYPKSIYYIALEYIGDRFNYPYDNRWDTVLKKLKNNDRDISEHVYCTSPKFLELVLENIDKQDLINYLTNNIRGDRAYGL